MLEREVFLRAFAQVDCVRSGRCYRSGWRYRCCRSGRVCRNCGGWGCGSGSCSAGGRSEYALDFPGADVGVPAAVEFTAAWGQGCLDPVTRLILSEIPHLVLAPYVEDDLVREVAVLVLDDEFLFRPRTACGSAAYRLKLPYEIAFEFECHSLELEDCSYSAVSSTTGSTYFFTSTTLILKMRVLLGSIL